MRGAVQPQTIDLPPLSFRADVGSVNAEERTVELIFSTGAPVDRFDWMSGKRYIERLSIKPEHMRIERLNAGAPLLDAHSAYSLTDQIGKVEPGSVRIANGEARATVRFSKREAVAPIWADVVDGIYSSVSVGYRVHRFEETTPKDGGTPTRLATLWEPYEVSLVPMPADTGAKVRNGQPIDTNACEIVTRGEQQMEPENTPSEFVIEPNPLETPSARTAAPQAPPEPNDHDLGANTERDRIQGIMAACRAARLPQSYMDKLIADKVPLLRAQSLVFGELSKRDVDAPHGAATVVVTGPDGDPKYTHARKGIENAILHRVNPATFPLSDEGREYRGMTMLDVARAFVGAQGIRTTGMSKLQIAGVALGLEGSTRSGYHSTSDFANLLADVANKNLKTAYELAPQTFRPLSRQITASDFKNINLVQFGEAPALELVNEHGEFKHGSIGDAKETFALKTYGKIFAITRQALINDDLDAFSRVPAEFGRAAMQLESDLVWAQITNNAAMGDGNNLFSALHSNLETDGDVISIPSLSRARTALRLQTGLDGTSFLNLSGKYLVVPPSLETVAQQYVGAITPNVAAAINPFTGTMQVISEPRLEADSNQAWYMAADPGQSGVDIIVYAYLEGQSGPTIETKVDFDIDGIRIKARHDFAAKIADWRGLHKDPGELVS